MFALKQFQSKKATQVLLNNKEGKDQESIQSSTTPDGKLTKTHENITYRRAKNSTFSKQVTTRTQTKQYGKDKHKIKKINKLSTALEWSVRKLLDDLI